MKKSATIINQQLSFEDVKWQRKTREEILVAVDRLRSYHTQGLLGGEKMPEDANPGLDPSSRENFHYFTLPMALNYQRNSYKMWEAALLTYNDSATAFVFDPGLALAVPENALRDALMKYKLALQPVRHSSIWRTLCTTIVTHYEDDIRNLFAKHGDDIRSILEDVQMTRKQGFPYLSGPKIANYWLYVMLQYTSAHLKNKRYLSIAPDTHIIQASVKLGLVERCEDLTGLQLQVAQAWSTLLSESDLCPIDIHTPLWLWSRNNFLPTVYG